MEVILNKQLSPKSFVTTRPVLPIFTQDRNKVCESFFSARTTAHTAYYDLPLPVDASQTELRICKYLEDNGVHMSIPSSEGGRGLPKNKRGGSAVTLNVKASFLQKRNKVFSVSLGNAHLESKATDKEAELH